MAQLRMVALLLLADAGWHTRLCAADAQKVAERFGGFLNAHIDGPDAQKAQIFF